MKKIKIITISKYLLIALCILLVAILGSVFVNLGKVNYAQLIKPTEWVPNIIFPVVWTIIYLLFAIVLFLLEKDKLINKKITYLLIINGILNLLWCLLFFTCELLLIGNIAIIINLIFSIILIINIFKIKKLYGTLLALYPFWICVATTLNLALWILN